MSETDTELATQLRGLVAFIEASDIDPEGTVLTFSARGGGNDRELARVSLATLLTNARAALAKVVEVEG